VDQRAFFKDVSARSRAGQAAGALQLLGEALRRGELDAEGVDKTGRLCPALFAAAGLKPTARVLLLGQCTTTWLASAMTAVAWAADSTYR
jgi:hypothetical protein